MRKRIELKMNDKVLTVTSSLKGNVSKVLGISSKLRPEEAQALKMISIEIDNYILSKRAVEDKEKFTKSLCTATDFLKNTDKRYIKERICSLIDQIKFEK